MLISLHIFQLELISLKYYPLRHVYIEELGRSNLNTDLIFNGSSNRFIVNDIYDRNVTFTGIVFSSNIITSNLSVIGDTTILNTTVYETEQLEILNNNFNTAVKIKQANNYNNLTEF